MIGNAVNSTIDGALVARGGELLLGDGFVQLTGELDINSGGTVQTNGSTLTLGAGGFGNPGTIMMIGGNLGGRVATGGTGTYDTLVLNGITVQGSGVIGANTGGLDQLNLINAEGTIDADLPGLDLLLRTGVANQDGLLTATNGGTLQIVGAIDQSQVIAVPGPGSIYAEGASTVLLDQGVITEGLLEAATPPRW